MADISYVPFVSTLSLKASSEEPTTWLRWMNGRLEQKWIVSTYENSTVVARSEEWREVPTMEPSGGDHG